MYFILVPDVFCDNFYNVVNLNKRGIHIFSSVETPEGKYINLLTSVFFFYIPKFFQDPTRKSVGSDKISNEIH